MVQKEIDYELLLFRCPHCKGPVRWHWNKATTGKVYCQNKCPECRAGQSKAEFNGNILIDGVPFEDKMILDELMKINKHLKSIEKLLSRLDDKFIRNKI